MGRDEGCAHAPGPYFPMFTQLVRQSNQTEVPKRLFDCLTLLGRAGCDATTRGKAQAHVPISFLQKKFKPIGACSGHSIAGLVLPGHLVPATFFNGFSSLPATYFPEFFKFLFVVRLLHKLGDADGRLTRQDRLFGHRLGRAGGCPTTPRKADDHCDDCPTNKAPNSILNLRCSLWLHLHNLLNPDFRYAPGACVTGASW